jgi:Fur family peroxide stress response transcriptional regulator
MIIQDANQQEVDHIAQKLREQGHRLTPQRVAILQAVISSHDHPTAEEIHQQVSAEFPMISLATVYKTMNVLKELGEVAEIRVDGRGHYEGNTTPHPHVICINCGAIIDLPAEALAEMPEEALAETEFQAVRYNLEIYGLCPRCQEKGASTFHNHKEAQDG